MNPSEPSSTPAASSSTRTPRSRSSKQNIESKVKVKEVSKRPQSFVKVLGDGKFLYGGKFEFEKTIHEFKYSTCNL